MERIEKKIVGIGSVFAAVGNAELSAYAIGSCIALCLYEPQRAVGAMAHILLPSKSYSGHENTDIDVSTKYADHALDLALRLMEDMGAKKDNIRAAVIGGAAMFPHGDMKILNIGEMNINSVREELNRVGIPILVDETGGQKARSVFFRIPGSSFSEQLTIKVSAGKAHGFA